MTLQRKLAMERAEGYAEGLELGRIEVLLVCVRNGYMTIERAAVKLGKTVEEVQAMLAEVKEPHNLAQAFLDETKADESTARRIGVAKGKFNVLGDFDEDNDEIAAQLEGSLNPSDL